MKPTYSAIAVVAAVMIWAAVPAGADPLYQLRVDGFGVPLILQTGTAGHADDPAISIGSTADGQYIYGWDGIGSGYEFHILQISLESANNAPSSAEVALDQTWAGQDSYAASVKSGVSQAHAYQDAITREAPGINSFFGFSGGGSAGTTEWRFEDSGGNYDADSGSIAIVTQDSSTFGQGGQHKAGLALIGETGLNTDTWMIVAGNGGAGAAYGDTLTHSVYKSEWGPATGVDRDLGTVGSRSITVGGTLTNGGSASAMISNLVPSIDDLVKEMAYNPYDGNLYFISYDSTSSQVYLSAVSFEWAPSGDFANASEVTYVDLDPDAAENYLNITYVAANNANDLSGQDLVSAYGLTFAPDGSRLFVSNGLTGNRVFQFDLVAPPPVPEPATLALLALGGLALVGQRLRRRS